MEPGPARYRVLKRLSIGGFGSVYSGEDLETHEEIAIKVEPAHCASRQLPAEAAVYAALAGGVSVPRFRWCGPAGDQLWLVIDRLSATLESLFRQCQRAFSLKTVLMLADQMLSSVQYLHEKGFCHRDVKPHNFMFGSGGGLLIIDYGLAKRYRDAGTRAHVQFCRHAEACGTAAYASLNALRGFECSRRDDLESIAYCLLYFMRGRLPWSGLRALTSEERFRRVAEAKAAISVAELCAGLPAEFAAFFDAVRALAFEEEPQYAVYRGWFRDLFLRKEFVFDGGYDWVAGPVLGSKRASSSPELTPRSQMSPLLPEKCMDGWLPRPQTGLRKLKPMALPRPHLPARK
jgi:serine/threonine protein kinase